MNKLFTSFILTSLAVTVLSCTTKKKEMKLVSIAVSDMTTEFTYGSTFSFDGVCKATYSDNSIKEITPTYVSEVDTKIVGEHNVTVSYSEQDITASTSYTVTIKNPIVEKTLDHIELSNMTTTIKVGNSYIFDGICTAFYSDSTKEVVTPTSVSSIDTSVAGEKTVVVSYTYKNITKSESFVLTVYEETIEKELVSISASNMTTQYHVGDTFSFDGVCTAHFSDGETETVTPIVFLIQI